LVAVYAICTVLGVVGILTWVTLGMVASSWTGKDHLDPEARYGEPGRIAVSAVTGLGLGGMSTSFAGWNAGLAAVGALVGAVGAVVVARYLGFEEDADGDSD
jgi:hypothetical protein